jgi:hypothetical protein
VIVDRCTSASAQAPWYKSCAKIVFVNNYLGRRRLKRANSGALEAPSVRTTRPPPLQVGDAGNELREGYIMVQSNDDQSGISSDGFRMLLSNEMISSNEVLGNVRAASWNIAAINNNPFEYWITYPDPAYNDLMHDVERIISDPKNDFRIKSVFTSEMFEELKSELQAQNVSGLAELEGIWSRDFSRRLAIKEFLQDSSIGDKRLTSMPDRITNTINLHDGSVLLRPTPINAYSEPLGKICDWWRKWIEFMFHTDICLCSGDKGELPTPQRVFKLISPIRRSKYPAITTAEQEISIPLQILCLAIMDTIFLNILNIAAPVAWESIRQDICNALIGGKEQGVCRIIGEAYKDVDVFFIQVRRPTLLACTALFHSLESDRTRAEAKRSTEPFIQHVTKFRAVSFNDAEVGRRRRRCWCHTSARIAVRLEPD